MAPRLHCTPGLEVFFHETELLGVPYVELYEVEKVGGYKYPQYAGPAFVTRLGGEEGSRLPLAFHIHVGPQWSLQLIGTRTCLEAAPGVWLLSSDSHSDPEGTFFLIAVGMTDADQACVERLEQLLKETCTYLVTNGYEAAALHMGCTTDDPKLLGLSSAKLASGMAAGSQSLAWGLNAAGSSIGNGISGSAKWATNYIPAARYESSINPAVQKGIDYTSKAATMTRNGIIWGIKSSVDGVAGLISGSPSTPRGGVKPQKPPGKSKSESVKALAKIGGQTMHSLLDVYDAMEDSVGSVLKGTADATTILVKHRHGDGAAKVTDDVFKATGSVVGTALGYRLYRRPAEGPLARTKATGDDIRDSRGRPVALPAGSAVLPPTPGMPPPALPAPVQAAVTDAAPANGAPLPPCPSGSLVNEQGPVAQAVQSSAATSARPATNRGLPNSGAGGSNAVVDSGSQPQQQLRPIRVPAAGTTA